MAGSDVDGGFPAGVAAPVSGGRRLHYGWVVVGVAFVTFGVQFGIDRAFGVFFVALVQEFGWSRAATAGAFSVSRLLAGIFSPVVGALLDRLGPRALLPVGALTLAVALAASSRITSLWELYLFSGVLLPFGLAALGMVTNFAILANWFVRKQGMMNSIALCGGGVGMFLLVPLVEHLIAGSGWRVAYLVLAGVTALVVAPLNGLFQRHRPEEMGLGPDGARAPSLAQARASTGGPREAGTPGWTLARAARTGAFWLLAIAFLFFPLGMGFVVTHQVAHMVDSGLSRATGASILGLLGLISIPGRLGFGYICDRFGAPHALVLSLVVTGIGALALMALERPDQIALLALYTVAFGLGLGARGPSVAALTAQLFRGAHFGAIFGFLNLGQGVSSAIGPWLGGVIHDRTGSYRLAFLLSLGSFAVSAACFWLAGMARRPGSSRSAGVV